MRKLLICIVCITLAGCSMFRGDEGYFRNRAKDFRAAYLVAPLQTPPGIDQPSQSDLFPVPDEVPEYFEVNLQPPYFNEGEA